MQRASKTVGWRTRKNRVLAHEICSQLDDRQVALCGAAVRKTDGAPFLQTLLMRIAQNIVDMIAVLRERLPKPHSCETTEVLALSLRHGKEDLDELQAGGSPPLQATVASSLKAIIGRISGLKNTHTGSEAPGWIGFL